MFKIQGHDQKEYGPVSADVLRQWIAERRANGQTLVQGPNDTGFRPLSDYPEFQEALAAASSRVPGPTPTPAPGARVASLRPTGPVSKGLAATSLVLGVLVVFFCFLTGLPAVITGHLALSRSKREPERYGGKGMATTGLVLGYLSVVMIPVVAILAGLMLPALAKAKGKAQEISCQSNLKMVGLAALMYSNDNKETFPMNFLSMSNELNSTKALICPGDTQHYPAADWATFSEANNTSYEYLLPGAKEGTVGQKVVFRCPIHGTVALGDGTVVRSSTRRGQ